MWSVTDPDDRCDAATVKVDSGAGPIVILDTSTGPPQPVVTGERSRRLPSRARCRTDITAVDAMGNAAGSTVIHSVRAVSDRPSSVVRYSGGWTRKVRFSAVGGAMRTSSTAGRWVRFRFTGEEVGLIATAPCRG